MNILIVEDNKSLAGNIVVYFELQGHKVDFAANGKQCLNLVAKSDFDAIIMDVMMPGMDGYETCRQLRFEMNNQIPVIFLTAKTELEDKLAGFAAGGDDYLVKPFDIEELMCRINALALRGKRQDIGMIEHGPLKLDVSNNELNIDDEKIRLNNVQYKIISMLMQASPDMLSKKKIEEAIWQDELPNSDTLKTHIYQLRKLLSNADDNIKIETVYGRGYRICYQECQ